jgi:hypothetical protein
MQFKLNFSSLALLAFMAMMIGVSPAFAAEDYMNVTVNISQVSEITVLPTSLSWTTGELGSITPGTDSTPQNILIKNTGSVNVSQIYLNASTIMDENSNPLGVANASAYSSAGFIFIRNGTNNKYYHAGRLEWNLSRILTGETVGTTGTNFSHGWYRNASGNDFLWKVVNGTDGLCNTTGTTFEINSAPENNTAPITLSRDLTGATACTGITPGDAWATFPCTAGPLDEYCVATYYDCSKIYIYRYNKAADFPSCTNSQYLQEGVIIPGDETASVSVLASVAKGVPAGDAKLGMLTFIAS